MRLGYCCHDSFPSSDTNTQQIFWTVFEVTRLGASVNVHVPSLAPHNGDARRGVAEYYGASAQSLPRGFVFTPLGTRDISGAAAKGWFDWRIARTLARGGYDLAWTRDPMAAVSCARAGVPFVFETYRPDFAEAAAYALWRRVVLASTACRGIVAHSRLTAGAFIRAGVPPGRVLVAHNGYAPSLMEPRLERGDARARVGLPSGLLVVYAGHVGPEKGLEALLHSVARVPEVTLVIVGAREASAEGRWTLAVAKSAGARVILRARVRVADVAPYLYAADCLAIPPSDAPLRRFGRTVLPMKVFSYLAAARPILAGSTPDLAEVLVDGESARLVPPGDIAAAARALDAIVHDTALQARLSAGALAASGVYTWEARGRKLLHFFQRILDTDPARRAASTTQELIDVSSGTSADAAISGAIEDLRR